MADQTRKKRGRGRPRLDATDGRDDIKRAALAEFAKHGFKGASIDLIAQRAGVAKRLIYYHFSSKDALWQQAVAEAYDEFRDEAIQFVVNLGTQTVETALDDFALQMVRFAAERVSLIQISIDENRQGGTRAEWLKSTYMVPLQRMMIGQVTLLFKDTKDGQAIASHLIPSMFGAIVFPFVNADVTHRAHGVDVFESEYIARHAQFIAGQLRACLQLEDRSES